MTIYAVTRKPCGCLAKMPQACRDQETPIGTRKDNADGSYTIALPADQSAKIPATCEGHRDPVKSNQVEMFG